MGFAIRHLTRLLNDIKARSRLMTMIIIAASTASKTHAAHCWKPVVVASIHCITIDKEARDYLPHMYGPAAYTIIDDVIKLPLKVSDIYRRITS